MARLKRGKAGFRFARVFVATILIVLAVLGWFAYKHFDNKVRESVATKIQPDTVVVKSPASSRVTLRGQLSAAAPVRDAQIGISAHAAILLREVEIFEHDAWTAAAPDPKAPFARARYVAPELRLEGLSVEPSVVEQQIKPVDYPVKAADLPPNMAATFTVRDGVLYAGGDPAHPAPGTLRVRYRIVPIGPATLSGLKKGTHLTQ